MRIIETIAQDFRFALRGWRKTPGYAFAAIATLALGIGANTAVFSVVSGVLLRPLPYADPGRLVQVTEIQPASATGAGTFGPVYVRDLLEFRAHSRLVERFVTWQVSSRSVWGFGEPERLATVAAGRELFTLLGASPIVGRVFRAGDPMNVAVVSASFWSARLNADPSAVGRAISLEGEPYTLLGVMPDEFQFPYRAEKVDLWIPWEPALVVRPDSASRVDAVVARLRPGVSAEAARQELSAMDAPRREGRQVQLTPLAEVVGGPVRESLLALLGAVGMVLLVACVNVANLLLARTAAREREISIRAALGAGRLRLVRQFLTESLLLSCAGGLAGLALGIWGRRALVRAAAGALPRADDIAFDWRVFLFLLAACVLAGIAFGLAPALSAARGGFSALRSRGAAAVVRDGLVAVEVALAFVLLAGAGLLLRTVFNLQRTDPGLRAENVLTVHMVVSGGPEAEAVEDRVSRIPGVRAAGFISMLPLESTGWGAGFRLPGRPEVLQTELRYVTPGYFRAMGIPVRAGRDFTTRDRDPRPEARVVVVNEALARRYFPGGNPVGVRIDRGLIVGVVGDVRQARLSEPATPVVFYTMAQNFAQIRNNGSTLAVSGHVPVETLAAAVRAAIREVSPDQALFRVSTMERVVERSLASERLYAWLLSLFAGIGALLAVAGIYGVVAYLVALRTREFGIRMALGADPVRVLRMVLRRGAAVVALGLVLGVAGAAILTRALSSILYGVAPADPATFAAMAGLLAAMALLACVVPAARAARVDPAVALRVE